MSEPATVYAVGRNDGGKRLDHFLKERIPKLSRSRIQEVIRVRVTLSWGVRARLLRRGFSHFLRDLRGRPLALLGGLIVLPFIWPELKVLIKL